MVYGSPPRWLIVLGTWLAHPTEIVRHWFDAITVEARPFTANDKKWTASHGIIKRREGGFGVSIQHRVTANDYQTSLYSFIIASYFLYALYRPLMLNIASL